MPTELWCDMILPGLGRFRAPYPSEPASSQMSCGGLRFDCTEPARTWAITYSGPMKTEGRTAKVALDLVYKSDSPVVDFGAHGDSWSLAGYMAEQKWSREWFQKLRNLGQTHYEQGGTLSGRITVDGRTREVSLASIRDHSYGSRDWKAMKRHAWLMALLEDGSQVNLSLVSYDFLPYMHSGYLLSRGTILPVTQAPRFEDLPADPRSSSSFEYSLRAGRTTPLSIRCRVGDVLEYTMDGVYRFSEGLASFTLGSLKGVGVCELGYACNDGLSNDPAR